MDNQLPIQSQVSPIQPPAISFWRAIPWALAFVFLGTFIVDRFVFSSDRVASLQFAGLTSAIAFPFVLAGIFLRARGRKKFWVYALPLSVITGVLGWLYWVITRPNIELGALIVGILMFYIVLLVPVVVVSVYFGTRALSAGPHLFMSGVLGIAFLAALVSFFTAPVYDNLPYQARDRADATLCRKEKTDQGKALCYKLVADRLKDTTICDQGLTKNSSAWVSCYYQVARTSKNPELCAVGDPGSYQDSCRKDILISLGDISNCATLPYAPRSDNTYSPQEECVVKIFISMPRPQSGASQQSITTWCEVLAKYPFIQSNPTWFQGPQQQARDNYCR